MSPIAASVKEVSLNLSEPELLLMSSFLESPSSPEHARTLPEARTLLIKTNQALLRIGMTAAPFEPKVCPGKPLSDILDAVGNPLSCYSFCSTYDIVRDFRGSPYPYSGPTDYQPTTEAKLFRISHPALMDAHYFLVDVTDKNELLLFSWDESGDTRLLDKCDDYETLLDQIVQWFLTPGGAVTPEDMHMARVIQAERTSAGK